MPAAAIITVDANTGPMEANILKTLNRLEKRQINLALDPRKFALGRITGEVNEFNKSLEASNARVIAFGASAGLIAGVTRAFKSLVDVTIDVEKQLADINVLLNLGGKELTTFGNKLFDVAKNTGQSFENVAEAAQEFARQGLGVEETLKRTQDALILTRLTGLKAADAVEDLTAAVNTFKKEGLSTTDIINRLATVDASFAVSSKDLAEAISRVGASAQDAGVNFNELIAIVTSVQQQTARGGAVIGNAFKSIFTRIQRTDTQKQLEDLGIAVRDVEGNIRPALDILTDFARVYDTLTPSIKASTAELLGGVFQINILKAAVSDLSKEYSTYKNALNVANSATDEATRRNEKLNQTLGADRKSVV